VPQRRRGAEELRHPVPGLRGAFGLGIDRAAVLVELGADIMN
jgi:hypothetical protein